MNETAKATILIVDDEEGVLALAKATLEEEGYETVLAANGQEALRACQEHSIDVAVVDVIMPGMSGPDLSERLKESLADKIIFTSGYGDGAERALERREPKARYLKKPFSPDALCDAVANVLSRS